jgi:hypothetical protein
MTLLAAAVRRAGTAAREHLRYVVAGVALIGAGTVLRLEAGPALAFELYRVSFLLVCLGIVVAFAGLLLFWAIDVVGFGACIAGLALTWASVFFRAGLDLAELVADYW